MSPNSDDEDETEETPWGDATYAEYEYRCDRDRTGPVWGSDYGSGDDTEDALRLDNKVCWTNYDCFDASKEYYYDDHRLECGFPVAREWPDAYN